MLADSSDFGLLGDQSSQKKLDYLPWTLINHHAKFDNASFILCGEIRDHTKKHKQQPIYPHLAYQHAWIITLIYTVVQDPCYMHRI